MSVVFTVINIDEVHHITKFVGSLSMFGLSAEVSTDTVSTEPVAVEVASPQKQKPRKLISLSYNYSDSDDEETREERKARIVGLLDTFQYLNTT